MQGLLLFVLRGATLQFTALLSHVLFAVDTNPLVSAHSKPRTPCLALPVPAASTMAQPGLLPPALPQHLPSCSSPQVQVPSEMLPYHIRSGSALASVSLNILSRSSFWAPGISVDLSFIGFGDLVSFLKQPQACPLHSP